MACCTRDLLGAGNGRPALLFGLYDGHCGRGAAEEAAAAMPAQLRARLLRAPGQAAAAELASSDTWAEAFQAVDKGLLAEEGCTATALLAWADAQGCVCLQVGLSAFILRGCCAHRPH